MKVVIASSLVLMAMAMCSLSVVSAIQDANQAAYSASEDGSIRTVMVKAPETFTPTYEPARIDPPVKGQDRPWNGGCRTGAFQGRRLNGPCQSGGCGRWYRRY